MDLSAEIRLATKIIDRWLPYYAHSLRIPGLSLGIVYKDQVIFSKGYGYADVAEQKEATETTCYRIASFSKLFTATAILQLFEQGKLQLDAPVQRYLPWFANPHDERTHLITIRQLLTHTSGLDRDGETPHWVNFDFPTLEQIKQHITAGGTVYNSAALWKYSNMGYTLLGEIIREVTGASYEAYVTEHIVRRLGLTLTAPTLTDEIVQHLAVGYSRDIPQQERTPFPNIETHVMASATGFSSNVVDLCKFMMAHFPYDLQLLQDETKREMRRIQWLRESDSDWTLGFQTYKIEGHRLYGHGGSFPGYQSRLSMNIEREIGVVVLTNAIDAPAFDLAKSVYRIIAHCISNAEKYAANENKAENSARYEGRFSNIWEDDDVVALNDHLILYSPALECPLDDMCELQPLANDSFKIISGDSFGPIGEKVRYEFDEEGQVSRVFVGPNPCTRA